ncbi:MAG TPA: hypothetical protein VNZ85_09960 [Caulobacter sp.]|nr:hypothetical protein [Caulobacter sp.]
MRDRRKAARASLTRVKYFGLFFTAVSAVVYGCQFLDILPDGANPILLLFAAAGLFFYFIARFCLKNIVPEFDGRAADDPMNY